MPSFRAQIYRVLQFGWPVFPWTFHDRRLLLLIAHLKLKPPAAHETAELQRKLQNNIYDLDQALLGHLWRLNQILQNDGEQWEDADRWSEYVGQAKDPSPTRPSSF